MGKMDVLELPLLTPQEMQRVYTSKFGSTSPSPSFTEQAILQIAIESRGVFRRFLKYIRLTLDHWYDRQGGTGPITPGSVAETIAFQQKLDEMEVELMEISPRSRENRFKAVQVLDYVRKSGEAPQRVIIDDLFEGNTGNGLRRSPQLPQESLARTREVSRLEID